MLSDKNIDVQTLINTVEQGFQLMDKAFLVVNDFDVYAERIVGRARKKILDQEVSMLDAARQDVQDNATAACKWVRKALAQISKRGFGAKLSKKQKNTGADVFSNLHLSLFEAVQIVYRAAPKRNKLHGRARKTLSQIAAHTFLRDVQ